MDKFDSAAGLNRACEGVGEHPRRFKAQNRTDSLASRKDAVAHGAVDRGRLRVFAWQKPFELCLDSVVIGLEKIRELHASVRTERLLARRLPDGSETRPNLLAGFIFRLKRLRRNLAVRFLQENFDTAFCFFQLFLAVARELYAFLEEFHGFVEGKICVFEPLDDFFEPRQGFFEIAFARKLSRLVGC